MASLDVEQKGVDVEMRIRAMNQASQAGEARSGLMLLLATIVVESCFGHSQRVFLQDPAREGSEGK
jgi:hypothetical protein